MRIRYVPIVPLAPSLVAVLFRPRLDAAPFYASIEAVAVPFVGHLPQVPTALPPFAVPTDALVAEGERSARARRIGRACATAAAALALSALFAWALRVEPLLRWQQGWPHISPWTALSLFWVAVAILLPKHVPEPWCPPLRFGIGAACALVALAHLAGSALRPGHAFARTLFPAALAAFGETGWMSTATSVALLALAVSVVALPRRHVHWSQAAGCLAFLVGLIGVANYFSGNPVVALMPAYRTMALPTAVAMCLLAVAALAVFADEGLMLLVTGDDAGAYLARQLLPYALLVPFVLRALELYSEHLGMAPRAARVLTLAAYVLGGVVVALRLARLLSQADRRRLRIEQELRRTEQHLREQEERTRIALTLTGVGTFEFDALTGRQALSDEARALWGFANEADVSPTAVVAAIHPADRRIARAARASLDPDGPGQFSAEHRVVLPDGRTRWIETRGHTLFGDMGGRRVALRSVGTMRDVTDRRRLDARVREAEERARLALDAASLGTYDLRPRTGAVVWDARAREMLGLGTDDAGEWRRFLDVVHPQSREAVVCAVAEVLEPGGPSVLDLDCPVVAPGEGVTRVIHVTGRAAFVDGVAVRLVGTMQDVTDQREAETKFRAFADSVPALCWVLDGSGRVTYANRPWTDYAGAGVPRSLDDWPGVVHPDDLGEVLHRWEDSIATGEPLEMESRLRRADGEYRWFLTRAQAQRDAGGRVVRWFGASVDVHEARRATQALGRSEQAFRIFIDSIPSPAWTMRADGHTDYVNVPWREYFGVGEDPADWQGWLGRVHPDDVPRTIERWARSLESSGEFENEYRLRGADGRYRWFLARIRAQRDEHGAAARWFGTATDIDAVKELEVALRESEATFRLFADAIPSLGWTATADGRITFVNAQWTAYTGVDAERSLADPSISLHPDDRARVLQTWADAVAGEHPHEVEYRLRRHDGSYRWFLARTWPQRDAKGQVRRWFGTGTDIDDAKRAEQVLRETEAALRDADRRKDEFLATLAHELRNPLAPIRQASRLASMPEASPAQVQWGHGVIDRQVAGMARLLDDLLDVSRITRGRLELRKEWVSVAQLVDAALETARPLTEARGHRLTVDMPARDLRVEVDPLRMSQVLGNLLTNAAKYTDPGGHVHLVARADDGALELRVRDTGQGIEPAMLQRVFEMFAQARPALERTEGGLGIGLALVRGIVELHGGTVEAHSAGLGQGSEFVVRVPQRAVFAMVPVPDFEPVQPRGARAKRRVLVADDNVDGAESLAELLRVWGHEVRVAHDGQGALDLAEAVRPDVLLLDIGMPGLNGYDVATAVRQRPWGAAVVLVAVTGWGHEEDRRRSLAAGFELHLTKPVDPQALRAVLGRRVAS